MIQAPLVGGRLKGGVATCVEGSRLRGREMGCRKGASEDCLGADELRDAAESSEQINSGQCQSLQGHMLQH